MKKHWAFNYIGIPYKQGGMSPATGLDCWGLFRLIYEKEFGIFLPVVLCESVESPRLLCGAIQDHELSSWNELESPIDGAAVAMSQKKTIIHHVGVYVATEPGRIVHCWEAAILLLKLFRNYVKKDLG